MDFGYVLRRAGRITWQHKPLWLFGFLVSLGVVGTQLGTNVSRWEQPVRQLLREAHRTIADYISATPFTVITIALVLVVLLALGFGLALLSAAGRAALVSQVRTAEDRGAVELSAGWQAGRETLRPVFFIRVLLGLPTAIVMLMGALPLIGASLLVILADQPEIVIPGALSVPVVIYACLFPATCLAILFSVPLNLLKRLAIRACVLEGLDVHAGIARAWEMLREHLGTLTLVWLILLGVGIGVVLLVGLPLALLMLGLMTLVAMLVLFSPLASSALTILVWLLAWLVGAAVGSVVETFFSATWTLAYRELTGLGLTGEEATSSA
jgi:hypothetical protein